MLKNAAIPIDAMRAGSDIKVRLSALELLVNNSLSTDDWMQVEPHILDLLRQVGDPGADTQKVIELAALTPLNSVRKQISRFADDIHKPQARIACRTLARLGESYFANRLIPWVVDESIGEETARTLAQIPLENMNIDADELERLTDTLDLGNSATGNAYLWSALALGRVGRFEKLEAAVNKLSQGESPPALWGNPLALESELGAMQPLPGQLSNFLQEKQAALISSNGAEPLNAILSGLKKDQPAPAKVVVFDLEIGLPQLRSNLDDAFPGILDRIQLPDNPVLPAQALTRVVASVLEDRLMDLATLPEYERDMPIEIGIGNELMTLVQTLPSHRPDAVHITESYIHYVVKTGTRSPAFETQLGSLFSTTGTDALLDEMSRLLNAKDTVERDVAWSLVSKASLFSRGGAPVFYGAGAETGGTDAALYRAAIERQLIGTQLDEDAVAPVEEVRRTSPDRGPTAAPPARRRFWPFDARKSASVGSGGGQEIDPPPRRFWQRSRKRPLEDELSAGSEPETGQSEIEDATTVTPVTRSAKIGLPPGFENPASASLEPAAPDDPPRSAYALLQCPDKAPLAGEFEVSVGLSLKQTEGVVGGEIQRPPTSVGSYFIRIRLVADGFTFKEGEDSEFDLPVTKDDPYPCRTLHLTPINDPKLKSIRTLLAKFSIDGQMVGAASRSIQLLGAGEQPDIDDVTPGAGDTAPGVDLVVPPLESAPDMTITITKGNTSSGDRLLWSMDSIHEVINKPPDADEDLTTDLGSEPGSFAKTMMNQVNLREGRSDLEGYLQGTGETIAEKIPFWIRRKLYELSGEVADRPPTLLIVSEEAHIPWELAFLKLSGREANYLATEFVVGRWVLGERSVVTGKLEPPVPPPTKIDIKHMFVVSGDYSSTKGWKRLEQAEKEAEDLGKAYKATQINATLDELIKFLDSGEDCELLHFAVHGKYDPSGTKDGIALVDGYMLDPLVVRSKKLKNHPLVFLNACQVGQGNTILGDYGGMAAAFLRAGAAAVIAPLWSVDDTSAKAIANSFYSQLKTTSDPAELVRCKREDFKKNTKTGTYLAYQFFGHPKMRIGLNLPKGDSSHE